MMQRGADEEGLDPHTPSVTTERERSGTKPQQQALAFEAAKASVLAKLTDFIDNSKKGGVDEPIQELIDLINMHPDYVTTSSCSGRVAIFAERDSAKKQTGMWLLASHEPVDFDAMSHAMPRDKSVPDGVSTVWFKFEPVILHIQCRSVDAARALLNTAIGAGMKNSGIMLGKKIMVAVRCSLKIECPIGYGGQRMVDDAYLHMLVRMTDDMFLQNELRTNRFQTAFVNRFCDK